MKVARADRTPRLDRAARQQRVTEARKRISRWTNKSIADALRHPARHSSEERDALRLVAADRLWAHGESYGER